MSGVRSMDMNHSAKAMGAVRNGNRKNQSPEVIGKVRKIEPRTIHVAPLKSEPEILRLTLRDHPLRNRPPDVLPAQLHLFTPLLLPSYYTYTVSIVGSIKLML